MRSCYTLDSNFVLDENMMLRSLNQKNPRIFIHPYEPDYNYDTEINGSVLELADQQQLLQLFLDKRVSLLDTESYKLIHSFLE